MNALIFLIVFPLVISLLARVVPHGLVIKNIVGVCANIALCAVPIYLLITYLDRGPAYFNLESKLGDAGMFLVELSIAIYIVYLSVRSKRYLPVFLVAVQSLIMVMLEFLSHGMHVEHS